MPEAYKAFVISPIGEPGSPERIHADWVLKSIIKPACERVKSGTIAVQADRSEHITRPGDIMEQVVESLIGDRVVFAVLAYDRPNVYYELALAHAAGRHVIILRHDEEKNHFDIKGQRVISYGYGMEGQALESKIAEVADFIRTVINEDAFQAAVFKNLNPLGRLYREYEFKESFRDISIPTYCEMFLEAKEFIGLWGISLMHFARQDFYWNTPKGDSLSFFDLVRGKVLFDAVSVHIVMMHEDNAALPHLIKFSDRKRFTQALKTVREEIRQSFAAWSSLRLELEAKAPERDDGRKGKLQVTQLVHGLVNYRLTLTDQQIVVTPYFNIFPFNGQGPAVICRAGTPFYDRIKREFIDRIVWNDIAAAALAEHGSLEIVPVTQAGAG